MTLSSTHMDQMYSLRGLNMITPDQTIDDLPKTAGQSPYTINTRLQAPQTGSDPRVSVQSRRGIAQYTLPVGEAVDNSQAVTTGQYDAQVTNLIRRAELFTPVTSRSLTTIELLMKNGASATADNIMVEVYVNVAGNFGTKIATSSIAPSQVSAGYTYVKARFANAPTLSTASSYWIVTYTQEPSVNGSYYLSGSTVASTAMSSIDGGSNWTATTGSFNYKVSLSDAGGVKGQHRFVTKTGLKQTLFAHGTSIYRVTNESTGAITAIATGLNVNATRVRFRTVYDKVFIVNGYDAMMKWDGTTMTSSTHTVDFPVPDNVIIYHDRAWYYSKNEPTKLYFSGIYPDLEVVASVNFQYVPDTSSADPLTGFVVFQDQLVLFTKESKYLLLGDDVSTLGLSQSPGGTKGAVSQESIAMGEKVVYFISVDGGAYYYDGAQDIGLSDNVQPEISAIADVASIDSIVVDKQWRIYYKKTGDSAHQQMLLLDLRYQEWLMDTETYTRLPNSFSLEDNTLIEASSTCGALYFAEAGLSQLGAPIKFRYWSNYKKYSSGIAKDRVKTFRAIFASPDKTITVKVGKDADFDNAARYINVILNASGILYDSGEVYGSLTALYGTGSRVSQPKVPLTGRANNTQFRFEKDVINTEVRLYGWESIVKSGRPR